MDTPHGPAAREHVPGEGHGPAPSGDPRRAETEAAVRAERRERRRIATGLHDQVGQLLVAARLRLTELTERAELAERDGSGSGAAQVAAEIDALLREALRSIRSLTFRLGSAPLAGTGDLDTLLEALCAEQGPPNGIEVEFVTDGLDKPLDDRGRAGLHRVVRELLSNVSRHAQTGRARVHATRLADGVRVVVSDDGVGFDPGAVRFGPDGGYGLHSAKRELLRAGGRLQIDSRPGGGTRITLTVPTS